MTTVVDRVIRGAALLDERGPASWRTLVDPTTLDLRDPGRCVVGQAYRLGLLAVDSGVHAAYNGVLHRLGAPRGEYTHAWAVEHGLEADGPLDYPRLTLAWRMYLATNAPTTYTDEEQK